MPVPGLDNSLSQLGTRFWITTDTEALQTAYDELKVKDLSILDRTGFDEIKTSDRHLFSYAQSGVTDKFGDVFGRAKAFASRIDLGSLNHNAELLDRLGGLEDLAKDIARLDLIHQQQESGFKGENLHRDLSSIDKMLKIMLATSDFQDVVASALSEADLKAVRLSLFNATLGALKLVREGKATEDSILELAKGEIYDISKAADVYKLSVLSAQRAREIFVQKDELQYLARSHMGTPNASRIADLCNRIVMAREYRSRILDIPYKPVEGDAKSLEASIKDVRRHMRAFRYDLDRLTGNVKGGMEGVRRWFDDLGGLKEDRNLSIDNFAEERRLVEELNSLLPEEERVQSCVSKDCCATLRATNLTHTANNEIRYYFSGKERSLDAFAEKAHKMLDEIPNGGEKTVRFSLGASVGVNAGGAKASVGGKYTHTARIERVDGEIKVTYLDEGALEANASVGFGTNDGDGFGANGPAEGTVTVGGGVAGKASASAGRKRTVTYRSVSDFIADLRGGSDLIDQGHRSVRNCLGHIWKGIRKIGSLFLDLGVAFGFREHHSRMDQRQYMAQIRNDGVVRKMDEMFLNNGLSVKTSVSKAVVVSSSAGVDASLNIGLSKGPEEGDDGSEMVSTYGLFGAGAGGSLSVSGDFKVNSTSYRPFSDSIANHRRAWLLDVLGGSTAYTAPKTFNDSKILLKAIETRMRSLEAQIEAVRVDGGLIPDDSLDVFASAWKKLAAEAELLRRDAFAALEREEVPTDDARYEELENIVGQIRSHLDRPNVGMTDEQYTNRFLETMFTSSNGSTTFAAEGHANIDVLDGLTDIASDAVGLGDVGPGGVVEGIVSTGVTGIKDTINPLSQSGSYKVSTTVKDHVDDPRPWANDTVKEIRIGIGTNTSSRALARMLADVYLKDGSVGDRPDLWDAFVDDLEFNLKTAMMDAVGEVGQEIAGKGLLAFFGKDPGKLFNSKNEVNGDLALTFRFEGGRLTSIAESDTLTSTGSLGLKVNVGGVEIGLKSTSSVSLTVVSRKKLVNASLDKTLGLADTAIRAGSGVPTFKNTVAANSQSIFRIMRAVQCKGDVSDPKAVAAAENDPLFAKDVAACSRRREEALKILGDVMARTVEAPKGSHEADLFDRAKHLLEKFMRDEAQLGGVDFASTDAEGNQQRITVAAQYLCDLSSVFTLGREAGFKRDESTGDLL